MNAAVGDCMRTNEPAHARLLPKQPNTVTLGTAPSWTNRHCEAGECKPITQLMEVNVARDKDEAINSYITDMLSLEEHIEKALRGQLEDLKDYPDVTRDLNQIHRKVEHHISDLRELSQRRNARTPADALKRVGSALLGLDRKSTRLNSSHGYQSRMPSSA